MKSAVYPGTFDPITYGHIDEFQLAGMNKKLNSKIETMFLMSNVENQIISSNFVKEIAKLGGNIDRFVTRYTSKMLKNKFL